MIDRQTWFIAQSEERKQHIHTLESGIEAYGNTYRQYFSHLGMEPHIPGKKIIEIGCADFPALYFCNSYEHGIIIEPMPSKILMKLMVKKAETIFLMDKPAEACDFPNVDEVWLFNVLQHVLDPLVIIEKAKKAAGKIRFFEPINTPLDKCHLHSFTLDYFKESLGDDVVKHYVSEPGVKNFHTQECAYGTWAKQ